MADAVWTIDDVAARFAEAARTSRRLPAVRVQGYFNVWPAIKRSDYERMARDDDPVYRFPPTPEDVARMLVVMQWVQWLEVEQRHLVWMRAQHYGWRDITQRLGCDRTTAWRRWQRAMQDVADKLQHGCLAA